MTKSDRVRKVHVREVVRFEKTVTRKENWSKWKMPLKGVH